MESEFVPYRKYIDKEPALALIEFLRDNGIAFELDEDTGTALGNAFTGDNTATRLFRVKLRAADFSVADALMKTRALKAIERIEPDHYLFSFTNDELLALLAAPDEWSDMDYQLARDILRDRGHEVSPDALEKLRQDRLQELAKPDTKNRIWILIGYVMAMLGGLLGIAIGWHLATYKKTLPDGRRIYDYSPADREHGQRISVIGAFMFIAITLWALFASE
jgi:hypothetical protein